MAARHITVSACGIVRSRALARLCALALLPALPAAFAAGGGGTPDPPAPALPNLSAWACHFCQSPHGFSGNVDLGVIGTDAGSYRFGKYTGLVHSGAYLLLDGELSYRDTLGDYLRLHATRLGLPSRAAGVELGRQGWLELSASYRGIPTYRFQDALTPFRGVGGSHLILPSSWVPGGSTAQMSTLASSLAGTDIRSQRDIYRLGLRFMPALARHWSFELKFRDDRQSGTAITGANFLTTSSLLPSPIHFDTDQIDADAQYTRGSWNVKIGYYGSFFHDGSGPLTWQDPFVSYVPGATVGRLGVPPDNAFNQLLESGAWQITPSTRLMESAAIGEELQDAPFMPATLNPDLPAVALPRASFGGRVVTGNYQLRLSSYPLPGLQITADAREDRHDNRTSRLAFLQAVDEVYLGATGIALPYSFDRSSLRLIADYSLPRLLHLELGGQRRGESLSYRAIGHSNTTAGWGQLRTAFAGNYGFSARYLHSQRSVGRYRPLTLVLPGDNPLLRKYDLADRIRQQILATAYYRPAQSVSLGLSYEQDQDQYDASLIGLTGDRDYSFDLDASWTPRPGAMLRLYLTRQIISADQTGSQSASVPEWYGHTSDGVNSVGFSATLHQLLPKTDIGIDSRYMFTREATLIYLGTTHVGQFPDNTVNDLAVRVYARYQLSAHTSLRFDYRHERYLTRDWSFDGVQPVTVPNVLTLGVLSPNYDIDLFALSARYRF